MKKILSYCIAIAFGVVIGVSIIPQETNTGGYEEPVTFDVTEAPEMERDFVSPIKDYRITSEQGIRKSPFTGELAIHYGVDMGHQDRRRQRVEIRAVADGRVIIHWPPPDGYFRGHPIFGGYIEIDHEKGISKYAHMSETFVKEGQFVKMGEVIGIMGDTGKSDGRHLHFAYQEAMPWEER